MDKFNESFLKTHKWKILGALLIAAVLTFAACHGASAETLMAANGVHHLAASGGVGGLLMANAAAVTDPSDIKALAEKFAEKNSEFKTVADELREAHKELKAKTDNNEVVSKEVKEQIDKLMLKFTGVQNNMSEIEQKLASAADREAKQSKSVGELLVESESFKNFHPGDRGARMGIEVKNVTSTTAGGLIVPKRENEIVSLLRERPVIRDLISVVPITTSSVEYPVQNVRTNNAAPVAEAAAKPYSDYGWTKTTAIVRTLAHLAKLTRQAVEDAPRLRGEVDSEMRYGLGYVEERQFLYGSNVGENLHGIVPQATAFAANAGYTPNALATRIDVLRLAILQVQLGLLPPDAIVLNPVDWALIEMTKTTDGGYLFAQPQGTVSPRMWGLPVVATPAMDADDFLVGAFRAGATIYDRMAIEVLISSENADDFEKNLMTMRAEERVALAVKRPGAFVTGDFGDALTAGGGMVPA